MVTSSVSALGDAEPATIAEGVRLAATVLASAGVHDAPTDARLLLAHAMVVTPTWLFGHDERSVGRDAWRSFRDLIRRRADREPLQHLIGHVEFWSLRVSVGPEVLIPRPETESLVETILEGVRGVTAPRVADVGTGSGVVALALAAELPLARIEASDVSAAALARASTNARDLGFEDRIRFVEGDLTAPLVDAAPYDAVAANLPYVTRAEWEGLEPEVRDHDPALALVGGDEGTELIARLADTAPAILRPEGLLALEVGAGQAERVESLLAPAFDRVRVRSDLSGIPRVVSGRRRR